MVPAGELTENLDAIPSDTSCEGIWLGPDVPGTTAARRRCLQRLRRGAEKGRRVPGLESPAAVRELDHGPCRERQVASARRSVRGHEGADRRLLPHRCA